MYTTTVIIAPGFKGKSMWLRSHFECWLLRVWIWAPESFREQESNHGISQLVSVVRFLSNRQARWISFFTLQLLFHNLIYPYRIMSILEITNYLVMVEMSYSTISTMSRGYPPQLSTTIHESYHINLQLVSILRFLSNSQAGPNFPFLTSSSY